MSSGCRWTPGNFMFSTKGPKDANMRVLTLLQCFASDYVNRVFLSPDQRGSKAARGNPRALAGPLGQHKIFSSRRLLNIWLQSKVATLIRTVELYFEDYFV